MSDSEKTSVAALISVILRRKINRVIDVKWLLKNQEYAREILAVSRELDQPELNGYSDRLETLIFGNITSTPVSSAKPKAPIQAPNPTNTDWANNADDDEDNGAAIDPSKYVGHLR